MVKGLRKTGVNATSAENYVIGAGIIAHDFKYESDTFSFTSFGATSGGTSVSLTPTLRQMEIDGVMSTSVGADMIETAEGTMEVNLLEATLENIKKLIIGEEITGDGTTMPTGAVGIRPKGRVGQADYIKDLVHISPLSDGGFLIIQFDYAIVTEGLEFNPQDGEDNVITASFSARANPNVIDDASLPVTIWRLPGSLFDGYVAPGA